MKAIISSVGSIVLAGLLATSPARAEWGYVDGRAGQGLRLAGGAVIYLGVICHKEAPGHELSVSLTIADKLLKDGEVPVTVRFDGQAGEPQVWRAVADSGSLVYSSLFQPKANVVTLADGLRNHSKVRLEITEDAVFEFPLERSSQTIGSVLKDCGQR